MPRRVLFVNAALAAGLLGCASDAPPPGSGGPAGEVRVLDEPLLGSPRIGEWDLSSGVSTPPLRAIPRPSRLRGPVQSPAGALLNPLSGLSFVMSRVPPSRAASRRFPRRGPSWGRPA